MSPHQTGTRRPHAFTARPGHGARWKITDTLSVRFLHDTVDGALHLRAVSISAASKRTVLKVKNRPGSRRCPNTAVLNLLLAHTAASTVLELPTITVAETAEGAFTLTLRGRANGRWEEIPDQANAHTGSLDPFIISGASVHEAEKAMSALLHTAAERTRPDASTTQMTALQALYSPA